MIDTLIGAAMELAADDRQVNLQQPSRSIAAVRDAATVPAHWRAFARCVLKRETGGVLANSQSREDAVNRSGSSASGRWQMLDASGWRTGGAWLVYKRLRHVGIAGDEAHRVRRYLSHTPIHHWDGSFQDMAFIQSVLEGGWFHWRNGGPCDQLVPR
jgi:hypothetical protein